MLVRELIGLKVGDLYLDAETPNIRIFGNSEKYWSVLVMKKSVQHMYAYLRDFH